MWRLLAEIMKFWSEHRHNKRNPQAPFRLIAHWTSVISDRPPYYSTRKTMLKKRLTKKLVRYYKGNFFFYLTKIWRKNMTHKCDEWKWHWILIYSLHDIWTCCSWKFDHINHFYHLPTFCKNRRKVKICTSLEGEHKQQMIKFLHFFCLIK